MDVQTLNEVGITLAGILGMGVFYWVGKNHSRKARQAREAQAREITSKTEDSSETREKK